MVLRLILKFLCSHVLSYKVICKIFILILCLFCALSYKAQAEELLGIETFYRKGNPYATILENKPAKTTDRKYNTVQPYTGPYFGWKTHGQPAMSPTKVAADGLTHILHHRVEAAKAHVNWLMAHAIHQHDTLFFPFNFDYAPFWPYDLKAPWYSALTQGLVLSLCVYLYRETQEAQYLDWSHTIYQSFLVPIDKGGITRFEDDGPFFEEYPTHVPSRVLNGAVVAMMAVHDYAKITGNTDAMELFQQSVKRLEALLPEYEAQTKQGIIASYYSLTPSRSEITGRFIGHANIFITDMNIYGHRGDTKALLSALDIGSENDRDVMRDFYVWFDPTYMNWGAALTSKMSVRQPVQRSEDHDSALQPLRSPHGNCDVSSIGTGWNEMRYAYHKLSVGEKPSILNLEDQQSTDWVNVQLCDAEEEGTTGTLSDASHRAGRAPLASPRISGREVNGKHGKYNHSPFKFFINTGEKYDVYSIEVVWTGLQYAQQKLAAGREPIELNFADQKSTDQIDVQFFDGDKYWTAGTIQTFPSDQEKRIEFALPPSFYDQWLANNPSKSKIDNRYIDDNQLLVKLIAELADSQIGRAYAKRWEDSLDLVPAQWFNEFPPSLFTYIHPQPVIPIMDESDESVHAEYPSVINIDGTFHMYYCAYGDSQRWQLFHATSTDGRAWSRHGVVFAQGSLPPDLKGNMAFPHVIRDLAAPQGYLMYFSASPERSKPYQNLHYASSKDGVTWHYEGIVIHESGLDPLVVLSPEQQYQMYYTKVHGDQISVMYAVSADGREFSSPVAALTFATGRRGLYTLSGFYLEQRLLLFLESTTPIGRHDTLLWIRDGDRFEPFDRNPLIIDKDWIPRWDARRYGFNFVSQGDKTLLYYNGIPTGGAEKGGQIGMAEVNLAMLKRMIEQ
jgi:hypothetical protein